MSELETIQAHYAAALSKDGRISKTQQRILAAALNLFAARGYAEVSTREIAECANVAEGTIFHNFVNKAGILDAIMQPIVKDVLPEMLTTLDQAIELPRVPTLEGFVVALVRDRVAFVANNRSALIVILSQFFSNAADRAEVLAMVSPTILAQADQAMTRLKAAGELVDWPNRVILQLIFSTLAGYLVENLLSLQPNEQAVQYLSDFLINGLTPRRIAINVAGHTSEPV
ncbi:TetR/AcrR family transcriptional regulator [Lactiplantibacillus plajomi]|uniref:TetR/AcrR family transcriptional regulator n=1 Tax=Lactiplantibacillus plajomi TaxID=1457217 RepID=A0ABV6K2W1_9LACO|nr:TetR/AcrR family transcriptional regulator [Lactiplantibacillus plajomi]